MKQVFNKIMFFLGVILFILGWSSIDSEHNLIAFIMAFGGLGIAYLNRSVYYEYNREHDEEF